MSINISTSVDPDKLQSLDPLRVTTDAVHPIRIWVELTSTKQWYNIIREANLCFGANKWRCQSRVRRKLEHNYMKNRFWVWFDVPDASFASWISVKLAVRVSDTPGK